MTYLSYIFLLDVSIFTTIDDEGQINSSSILEGFTEIWRKRFENP